MNSSLFRSFPSFPHALGTSQSTNTGGYSESFPVVVSLSLCKRERRRERLNTPIFGWFFDRGCFSENRHLSAWSLDRENVRAKNICRSRTGTTGTTLIWLRLFSQFLREQSGREAA